jgi:hypothetical protein
MAYYECQTVSSEGKKFSFNIDSSSTSAGHGFPDIVHEDLVEPPAAEIQPADGSTGKAVSDLISKSAKLIEPLPQPMRRAFNRGISMETLQRIDKKVPVVSSGKGDVLLHCFEVLSNKI